MNREVNVTKRVKIPQGLRYCPVVLPMVAFDRTGFWSLAGRSGIRRVMKQR
jgi:hypothetical protein